MRRSLLFVSLGAISATVAVSAQPPRGPQPRPLVLAIDVDHDGTLSAAEIANASAAILTLDLNKDGKLTQDEFLPRMQGAGASADEMVKRLMALDANGDGVLTKDEVPERMQGVFERGDANKDGKLTADEIKAMAGRQGMPNGRRVEPGRAEGAMRMDAIINALDANHDAVIDATEIANAPAVLKSLDKNGDGILEPNEFAVRQQTPEERANHMLDEWDTNKDGKIAKEEAPEGMQARFATMDTNGDGFLTKDELLAFFSNPANMNNMRGPGGPRPGAGEGPKQ